MDSYTESETAISILKLSNSIQIGDGANPCIDTTYSGKLTIPEEIDSKPVSIIGSYAFSGCIIEYIELPNTIEIIKTFSFTSCYIKNFSCPSSVKYIEESAFYRCKFKFADFSQSKIQQTSQYTFAATLLENILLPPSIVNFASHFLFESNIKNITIPYSTISIEVGSLTKCSYLTEFFSDSPNFKVVNNVLYTSDFKTLIGYPAECNSDILPTVQNFHFSRSFSGTSFVKYVLTLPIKKLGTFFFRGCPDLEYLDLSCSLETEISHCAFCESPKLKEIILPPKINYISSLAFFGTKVQSITFPASLKSIDNQAFKDCLVTDIYYCGNNNVVGKISSNPAAHVSISYSYDLLLGCKIADKQQTCKIKICPFLFTDQKFLRCPSVKICNNRINDYSIFIVFILIEL